MDPPVDPDPVQRWLSTKEKGPGGAGPFLKSTLHKQRFKCSSANIIQRRRLFTL